MATGILNHMMTAGQALKGMAATPMDGSTNGTGGTSGTNGTTGTSGTDNSDDTSSSSATISANDFLTLLVTEMQNQDPTADTDPERVHQPACAGEQPGAIDRHQPDSERGSGRHTVKHRQRGFRNSAGTSAVVSGTSAPATTAAAHTPASAHAVPAAIAQTTAARRTAGNVGVPAA